MTKNLKTILNSQNITSAIKNIATEIIKQNKKNLDQIVLIGILTKGHPLAQRIAEIIKNSESLELPVGKLDISLYRDDLLSTDKFITIKESDITFDLTGKHIILVDDVLFHGRTIRAALDALLDYGRPQKIDLAVLIDRGHRQLPISANYIGKTIETNISDHIQVNLQEIDNLENVIIQENQHQ